MIKAAKTVFQQHICAHPKSFPQKQLTKSPIDRETTVKINQSSRLALVIKKNNHPTDMEN